MSMIPSLLNEQYMNVPRFISLISFGIYLLLNYCFFSSYKAMPYNCFHGFILLVSPLRPVCKGPRVVTLSYSWHPLKSQYCFKKHCFLKKFQTKIYKTKAREQSYLFTDTPKQTDNPVLITLETGCSSPTVRLSSSQMKHVPASPT